MEIDRAEGPGSTTGDIQRRIFHDLWAPESVPARVNESFVVSMIEKGSRNVYCNHRGISLTPVVTKPLVSITIDRSSVAL